MKTYKTYQARNAVKAAQVTNHIIAQKKLGVAHEVAKAEAYRLFQIKAASPILLRHWGNQGASTPKLVTWRGTCSASNHNLPQELIHSLWITFFKKALDKVTFMGYIVTMKTTYAWAAKRNSGTHGKHVIYAGITQRANVSDRFSGGYEFRHSNGNIRHGGLVRNKTISVRKSDIVLLETHELKSYYDQDLMNNFHEQLYINAVRKAGIELEGRGVPVKVGNVNDAIKYFSQWRLDPEACEAGWYQSVTRIADYQERKRSGIWPRQRVYMDWAGTATTALGAWQERQAVRRTRTLTKQWKDTACKKFIDWCESDNDGHLCDVDVYNSIMEKIQGWNKSTNWEMAYRGEKGA